MLAQDSEVKIRAFSDIESLRQFESQWGAIVENYSNNPFLLSEFIKQAVVFEPDGWTPLVLILSKGKKIIGVAPLKIRIGLAERRVDFLQPNWCSDFIFHKNHIGECVKYTCDFLFKTLRCNNAKFVFAHDSASISELVEYFKRNNIHMETYSEKGRRIIPINSSWSEFKKSRRRKFRKELKRMKRHLNKAGSWRVTTIEENKSETVKKIFEVEKKSWKELWRHQTSKTDWNLRIILKALQELPSTTKNFSWRTWFLELEGIIISYVLGIIYKDVAILAKTSYDKQYRRLSPGIITQIFAIQELFESQIKYVDFLSDLKFHHVWSDTVLPRVGVVVSQGTVPTLMLVVKQKIRYVIRSSAFLRKQAELSLSQGKSSKIFDFIAERFL